MTAGLPPHEIPVGADITHCPVVGDHITVEAPLIPKDVLQKVFICAARHARNAIVGCHDGLGLPFPEAAFKDGQEVFPQRCLVHIGGGGIPVVF